MVFLDEIDDVNNDLNMIIIVTINDTSRVHFSIINRPGRFDKVIEIKPPASIEEIRQVMVSKSIKLKSKYCAKSRFSIPKIEKIDGALLKDCLKHEFTQAEITNAIVEQIFIYVAMGVQEKKLKWNSISDKQFNELFKRAIDSHKKTKLAIKNCDFNNTPPTQYDDDECKKECAPEPRALYPTSELLTE
jgi:SpoVK/Ycf46/Vps4 family AAA+-type ATPase